jgi:hypothetical protein
MAASLVAVLLASVPTLAQQPVSEAPTTLHFLKPAGSVQPAAETPATLHFLKPAGFMQAATYQQPPMSGRQAPGPDTLQEYQIQLEPPGPQRIFRLESEASLNERMRQEARERPVPDRIVFPSEPVVGGKEATPPRNLPSSTMLIEPSYLCYNRLYFEQPNFERYGWDLGPVTPFVSAGKFYWDLVFLPNHFWTEPCRCYECSAGYCLPGDPVPLLLYPPQLSLTGAVGEAATAVALLAIFP